MLDMWNWLLACSKEDNDFLEVLELVMIDDEAARTLWDDYSRPSGHFIDDVRDEVGSFIAYLKDRKIKGKI